MFVILADRTSRHAAGPDRGHPGLPCPVPSLDPAATPFVMGAAAPAAAAGLWGRPRLALTLVTLPLAVAAFFRDPDRTPDHRQPDADVVLAPADGRVMHAGPAAPEVAPGDAPEGGWQQVSIFLSLFDVHVNRSPYAGRVEDVTYRPGSWHAAYRFESATENERSEITLRRVDDGVGGGDGIGEADRRVVFRQVVGLVARRVVTRVRPGDVVRTGQRIGVMKFGSRMDVFLPPEVQLTTAVGDRTVAGETVVGRWPGEPGRPASSS